MLCRFSVSEWETSPREQDNPHLLNDVQLNLATSQDVENQLKPRTPGDIHFRESRSMDAENRSISKGSDQVETQIRISKSKNSVIFKSVIFILVIILLAIVGGIVCLIVSKKRVSFEIVELSTDLPFKTPSLDPTPTQFLTPEIALQFSSPEIPLPDPTPTNAFFEVPLPETMLTESLI